MPTRCKETAKKQGGASDCFWFLGRFSWFFGLWNMYDASLGRFQGILSVSLHFFNVSVLLYLGIIYENPSTRFFLQKRWLLIESSEIGGGWKQGLSRISEASSGDLMWVDQCFWLFHIVPILDDYPFIFSYLLMFFIFSLGLRTAPFQYIVYTNYMKTESEFHRICPWLVLSSD